MATTIGHAVQQAAWALIDLQHGVIARRQLLALGFTAAAIRHRIDTGRLHRVYPGIYAVGRPQLTHKGTWMAAVLACGAGAVLSHGSAGALLGMLRNGGGRPEVSVPRGNRHRPKRIIVHRRRPDVFADVTVSDHIPVTSPLRTLIDLAARAQPFEVERLVNEADKLDLIDAESVRTGIDGLRGAPGVLVLREVLDRATFTLTDSALERLFLPIARRAGLPKPRTRAWLHGFRVDFYWPNLGLVVETDGLRYHRTPAQQARHTLRDNAHQAAGLVALRFTHAQVRHEPEYVETTLRRASRTLPAGLGAARS
jgi:very-short-patch-repair endonuclease